MKPIWSEFSPLNFVSRLSTCSGLWARITGNRLHINNGNRTFSEDMFAACVQDDSWGSGSTFIYYDLDCDLDMFVINNNARPILYRNDGGNTKGWLRIEFATAEQSIGARIAATAEPGRRCAGVGSQCGQQLPGPGRYGCALWPGLGNRDH